MRTKSIILFILLLLQTVGWGQRTITGKVVDKETGAFLMFVPISVVGSERGDITDYNGEYELQLEAEDSLLVVNYVGFLTDTIRVKKNADYVLIKMVSEPKISGCSIVITKPYPSITGASTKLSFINKYQPILTEQPFTHPYQLLQSRVSGLQISQPGNDPNGIFTAHIRGLNSLYQNSDPLIVIDGVPALNINQIDPENIAKIEVLRDATSAARYGIRGAGGLIKIETKTALVGQPLQVQLHSFIGTENITRRLPFANRADFVRAGGTDLGSETNWLDEITEAAFSQAHHLSFAGQMNNYDTNYRVGLTYRNINGTLRNSGLQRMGARIHFRQNFFHDKLNIQLKGAVLQTDRLLGMPVAFRYAHIYNPTAPIFGKDDLSEQFGGYFQQAIFDYFNPIAIVEQTTNNAAEHLLTGNMAVNYKLFHNMKISLLGSQYNEQNATYFAVPTDSYFGNFNGLSRQQNFTQTVDNQYVKANVNYTSDSYSNQFQIYANAGYDAQWITRQSLDMEVIDAAVGELDFSKLINAQTYFNENTTLFAPLRNALGTATDYHERHRLVAFYGDVQLEMRDKFVLAASLRREGSSRLGINNKWGWFPTLSGRVNFAEVFDIPKMRELNLRANYGITGSLPVTGGLSLAPIGQQGEYFYNGAFRPILNSIRNGNPDLTYEQTRGVNFGLDIQNQQRSIRLHLDWYRQNSDNLIEWIFVPSPPFLRNVQYQNSGALRNQGVEIALHVQLVEDYNFQWKTQLNIGHNRTTLVETGRERSGQTNLIFSFSEKILYSPELVDEPIGTIIAPVLDNYTDDIRPTLVEQEPGVGFSAGIEDFIPVGNIYPKADLGWYHDIKWGNVGLNFLLRGTFAHDMINANRVFYEVGDSQSLNVLQTKYAPPRNILVQLYHNQHVENASFIRLDNIALSYQIEPKIGRLKYKIYLAARNLFTITGYTGNDPELRLDDNYYNFYYSNVGTTYSPQPRDLRQAGIDVRNTYYLARTVILGIRVQF